MRIIEVLVAATLMSFGVPAVLAADDILDAMDQARKAYQAGDYANAKQSLDLASQLLGQKNAEAYATVLPKPLAGWTAEKAQTQSLGGVAFGASTASRQYNNANGETVEIQITGDSAMVAQLAPLLANPAFAGAMGKLIRIGNLRAIQTNEGDIQMVVANKFHVMVSGSAPANAKIAYAQAIEFGKLSKM